MIFVTIGTQEPFDRLIKAIDELVPALENEEFIVQAPLKDYRPINFKTIDFMDPQQFRKNMESASLIISHAGMGTILSAMTGQKALLIMPRLVKYGEHRNEHQLATAKIFKSLNYINVAENVAELKDILLNRNYSDLHTSKELGEYASGDLIQSIRNFIAKK